MLLIVSVLLLARSANCSVMQYKLKLLIRLCSTVLAQSLDAAVLLSACMRISVGVVQY
jgi:hypothetical protein